MKVEKLPNGLTRVELPKVDCTQMQGMFARLIDKLSQPERGVSASPISESPSQEVSR